MPERSPTGKLSGKSTLANIWAAKIHQPAQEVTNKKEPAAVWSLAAAAAWPSPRAQYSPARQEKAQIRVKKMVQKTILVRRAQMR